MSDRVPLDFIGIRVELPTNTPILLLKERSGDRYLPIWINTPEATSIALAHDGYSPQRPMTHDLLTSVIEELGATVEEIVITELRGGTFFADLVLKVGEDTHTISSRPSDAVSVAVRVDAPLFAVGDVLDEAGVHISDETEEDEIAKFREFLDDIDPDDFESSGHNQ
ncbi:MAG: bifunctional nuclease family protein [Acidimicrobiia bacterium]